MPSKSIEDLNRIYSEAEEVDRELFAEMRSNLLLIAGEHYSKINARIASQVRQTNKTPPSQDQKLRLTKNHCHKVHRTYMTNILSEVPGTTVKPQRDKELQDQKDAELNLAVWQDVKHRHKLKRKTKEWCSQYTGIGEVCVKVFWDPNAGQFKGYGPKLDEMGAPVMKETGEIDPMTGQPVMIPEEDTENPQFTGDFVYEDVFGFNLLREAGCESMDDPDKAWIVRKMVDTKELKKRYSKDPDKVTKIQESSDRTYIVFDANKGTYHKKKGETLVKEYYWRPCLAYPEGYFVYATDTVVLEEGPLPFGLFPLKWAGFDKYASTPRGRSIIKVVRPYQAEINRASSSMATAQVTMGDDKLIYSSGAKMAPGALLPGVRGIAVTGGMAPVVLPGRSGAQYLDYVNQQTAEMYSVVMMDEMTVTDKSGQLDPYALLFKSASQKKKYEVYTDNFEEFLVSVTELTLELAKHYLPDDMLISAVGRRETINIPEFRKTTPLAYQIVVEPQSETLETQFGKQLTFQHVLQYVGKQLDPKIIGKLIKNSPFANYDDSFDELTIDEDIAKNDMLALERGEPVEPTPYVDPTYMARKLTFRKKQPDFRYLDPLVQQSYAQLIQAYEAIAAEQAAKIAAAKNEYIPVDGALVTCDFYVPDPTNPDNQAKRAKIPQRALEWLLKRLEEQGITLDKLEGMNAQALSEIADMIFQGQMQGAPGGQVPMQIAG